jgi:hypothetical protein
MIKIKKFKDLNEGALPRKRSVDQLKKLRKLTKGIDIGDRVPDLKKQGANIHLYQNPIDTGIESYEDFEKKNKKFVPSWNLKNKLSPFNESSDEYSDEIQIIKNVLIDLKDEYEYIDGEIFTPKSPNDYFRIKLFLKDVVFKGEKYSLELQKNKSTFINFSIKVIERLELATHMKSKTLGLFEWADCDWRSENSIIEIFLIP